MQGLRQKQKQMFDRLELDFQYFETEEGEQLELSLANIQNCLWEFYKYHKILHSNGRVRLASRMQKPGLEMSCGAPTKRYNKSDYQPHHYSAV